MPADSAPALHARNGTRSPLRISLPRGQVLCHWTIFALLLAGLAWVPYWYGSNDLIAWGINAVLFASLAAAYEMSLLVTGQSHPIALRWLALPAALFLAVALWVVAQAIPFTGAALRHPIWGMAADALGRTVKGSISVNRDLTDLALLRLVTAGMLFWLTLQLCRDARRAEVLLTGIAVIVCGYAVYGLIAMALRSGRLPGFETPRPDRPLASTLINRNSFATYAGIGLVIISGYLAQVFGREMTRGRRVRVALLLESAGRSAAPFLAAGFVTAVALLLTGSRGGFAATLLGLIVLVLLGRGSTEGKSSRIVLAGVALLAGSIIVYAFGDTLVGGIEERGVIDSGRIAVAVLTLRSIIDAPLLGYGYGTFADVFPLYRDRSIGVQGAWDQAHNTYLEVFQGLGLVFGALLVASVVLLVLRCISGARTRKEHRVVPRVAVATACLVGAHSMVDFSLQIQGIALTFVAVLAAGVAQSASSRLALED